MSESDTVPALKARVVELELEVSSLKAQLRRSEMLLLEATNKTVKPYENTPIGSYLRVSKPTAAGSASTSRAGVRNYGPITLKLMSMRNNDTNAVRTQIIEWINRIMPLEPALTPEDLMDRLSTGVILCNFALVISESAIEHLGRVHTNAKPYSLLAHENIQAFIRCAIRWGVNPHECCCANDVLSSNPEHRDERAVLFTLLALSRVVYHKFGIQPPGIIAAEDLIDRLDSTETSTASLVTATTVSPVDSTTASEAAESSSLDRDVTGLTSLENEQIHHALQAFCMLHQIHPMPQPTQRRGEYIFADKTTAHVRVFDADTNRDGDVLSGVQDGSVALLVRHKKKEWVNLLAFAEEHKDRRDGSNSSAAEGNDADNPLFVGTSGAAAGAMGVSYVSSGASAANVVGVAGASAVGVIGGVTAIASGENGVVVAGECVSQAELKTPSTGEAGGRADALAVNDTRGDVGFSPIAVNITIAVDSNASLNETNATTQESIAGDTKHDRRHPDVDGPTDENAAASPESDIGLAFTGRTRSQALCIGEECGTQHDDAFEEVGDDILPTGKTALTALMSTRDYEHFRRVATTDMACMTEEEKKLFAEYTAKQEFFYLTALSVKMTHALRDDVAMVPTDVLWRLALKQQVPFHRFHSFIQHEITKKYLEAETTSRMQLRSNLREHRESMVAVLQARQRHNSTSIMDE